MFSLDHSYPPIVHLFRFPRLTINHAVLLFAYEKSSSGIRFQAYDPNQPDDPVELFYESATRTFFFPRTIYFAGGRVDAYQIYDGLCY